MVEPQPESKPVRIPPLGLDALLGVPDGAKGLVIFAHGSGSGRHSPRNNQVAAGLRQAHLATLLLDLLRPEEEGRANVFDIELLASRPAAAADWARGEPRLEPLPIGYFGARTGAAGALVAAARDTSSGAAACRRASGVQGRAPGRAGVAARRRASGVRSGKGARRAARRGAGAKNRRAGPFRARLGGHRGRQGSADDPQRGSGPAGPAESGLSAIGKDPAGPGARTPAAALSRRPAGARGRGPHGDRRR